MKLFRAGIFEYDKRKPAVTAKCERCGAPLDRRGKRFCSPCYGVRYEENIAANRSKYKHKKYGRKEGAGMTNDAGKRWPVCQ